VEEVEREGVQSGGQMGAAELAEERERRLELEQMVMTAVEDKKRCEEQSRAAVQQASREVEELRAQLEVHTDKAAATARLFRDGEDDSNNSQVESLTAQLADREATMQSLSADLSKFKQALKTAKMDYDKQAHLLASEQRAKASALQQVKELQAHLAGQPSTGVVTGGGVKGGSIDSVGTATVVDTAARRAAPPGGARKIIRAPAKK